MKPNFEKIVPRVRDSIISRIGRTAGEQAGVDAPMPGYMQSSVDLAIRIFGENAEGKTHFKEIRTPTEEDLQEIVNKFRAASRTYYESGSRDETGEEWRQRSIREDAVNEARQKEAAAYAHILRKLGQGHVVDSVNRRY